MVTRVGFGFPSSPRLTWPQAVAALGEDAELGIQPYFQQTPVSSVQSPHWYVLATEDEQPTCWGHDSSRRKLRGLGPLRGHRPSVIRELWREWQVTQSTVGWPGTRTLDRPGITNWWKSPWQDPYLSPKDIFLQLILQDFWQISLRLEEKIYNSQLFTLSTYINSLWGLNKGNLNVRHISHSCGFWKMVFVFVFKFLLFIYLFIFGCAAACRGS